MPQKLQFSDVWLPCLVLLVLWARPTAAFGAGNIASLSKIEGQNWRHGDIEDTLLTLLISGRTGKKFSKMDVKRVYFGNWLRDYSQAVDVGTVKMVSAEAIRILLWVLGFISFGYGTSEFEVTRDRLGCYRPEEHIDNPKDYADNLDARQYDRRLRAPVDERRELGIDQRTGLKNYIASEDLGITTSAGMVRNLLRHCIDLGRRSGGKGPDFYEALRLLGTATHCLEDYSAHSNYTELVLIQLGVNQVFPHVGEQARVRVEGVRGEVYPIITGTFGGVDFLHSVCGELSDKATQSEMQELEGAITDANRQENKSQIKDLLSKLPDGIFGGKDQAGKADELQQNAQAAQMGNMRITPKEPEAFTQQIDQLVKEIYPIMQFHDEIMQSIAEFVEKIPVLPELIEQVQDQISVFVFSLLAPYVLPIIKQVKAELETGSSEVIASAREKQHIVFNDPRCTDPTHSMLSKDHFTNILNPPAGQVASAVLKWAIPQIVACWDGQGDTESTIDRIIKGVFHHPAQVRQYENSDRVIDEGRNVMFNAVRDWWGSFDDRTRSELTEKLSRNGVQRGDNHRNDLGSDTGHGCCKPLTMQKDLPGLARGGSMGSGGAQIQQVSDQAGKLASEAIGGGALGGIVGGLVGGLGGSILGGAFGDSEKKSQKSEKQSDNGAYTQSYSESGYHKKESYDDTERYGQAQYRQTQYPGGGRREEFSRQEQDDRGGSYGYQQRVETSSYSGSGGYERREERRVETGGQWQAEVRREGFDQQGQYYNEKKTKQGKKYGNRSDDGDSDEDDDEKRAKKERKRREKEEKKHRKQGSGDEDSDDDAYRRRSGEHGRTSKSPKRNQGHGGGNGQGRDDRSGYGGVSSTSSGYGGGRHESSSYGGDSHGSSGGYGRQESSGYGGDSYGSSGRQQASGYGGDSYSSSGRQQASGYGGDSYSSSDRQQASGYGGDSYSSGGRQESSGYGGDSYSSGGYGGRQETSGYGGGQEQTGHGRGNDSYGSGGGYGGGGREEDSEFGQGRRQQGSGGGGDYEDEGYGRRY